MRDSLDTKKRLLGVPIKINLDINIDGKSENVILTSSMIYIPSDEDVEDSLKTLETYPRIPTQNVRLPVDYLKSLKYKEIVNFFFNKKIFNEVMEKYVPVPEKKSEDETENIETMTETVSNMTSEIKENIFSSPDKQKEIIQIEKLNVELMIHLLFPTFSFYSEGYKTSMQYWNSSEGYLTTNPITPFSYLRYNETIYTITNAVWLNDVFNVPFYRELIESYENYKNWKLEVVYYLETMMEKIQDKSSRIKDEKTELVSEIEDFEKQIDLIKDNIIIKQKEYEEFIESNIYQKYVKPLISQSEKSQKPTYIYDIIFSSDETLTYSNTQLNELIYSYKNENDINNEKMFEIMMENISDFLENKGDVSYLKREICEGKEGCSSNVEMSSFYYTGILYNHHLKNNEPIYEAYFLIDVIEGGVNETNIAGIKCKYDNESIGKRIEFLSNQWPVWDLSNRRIFMKLNSGEENPLVTKTMSDYHSNLSASNSSSKDTNYSKTENVQKMVEKLVEFEKTENEPKFKNALELLYENITYKEKEKPSFNNKIKKLELSFKDKLELELNSTFIKTFIKWLQNPNKYPPPPKNKTNDDYTSVDKYIYDLLDKIQSKNTKKDDLISYIYKLIRKIQNIEDNNNNYDLDIDINTRDEERLKYVNFILRFYVGFLTSLSNYLENKNQRGGYVFQEDSQNSSKSPEKINHTKTQKQSNQEKKRITRKRVIF